MPIATAGTIEVFQNTQQNLKMLVCPTNNPQDGSLVVFLASDGEYREGKYYSLECGSCALFKIDGVFYRLKRSEYTIIGVIAGTVLTSEYALMI